MAYHIRHNLDDLSRAFRDLAENTKRTIVSRSINTVAGTAKTQAKRLIVRAGGFRSGYVGSNLTLRRSSAATLEATIAARGRFSLITRFSPRYGNNGRTLRGAKPWSTSRSYRNVFVINSRNGGQSVPLRREGGRLKALYGPSVGREMERDYVRGPVERHVGERLPAETVRYARVYFQQVKGRYRL